MDHFYLILINDTLLNTQRESQQTYTNKGYSFYPWFYPNMIPNIAKSRIFTTRYNIRLSFSFSTICVCKLYTGFQNSSLLNYLCITKTKTHWLDWQTDDEISGPTIRTAMNHRRQIPLRAWTPSKKGFYQSNGFVTLTPKQVFFPVLHLLFIK